MYRQTRYLSRSLRQCGAPPPRVRHVALPFRASLLATLVMTPQFTGCVRNPIAGDCPSTEPGALVISEIRGANQNSEVAGDWIELFNATATPLELSGTVIELRRKDGGAEQRVVVRRSVELGPGEYAVLARVDDAARPAFVDYGYGNDAPMGQYAAGAITVFGCGTQLDRVLYDALPTVGSYALSASAAPTAARNDDARQWCVDTQNANAGTPGQVNLVCP